MRRDDVCSLFNSAGIPILHMWQLPNGYSPIHPDEDDERIHDNAVRRARNPWWLVKTSFGCIEIGFRRHVYSIDWSDTPIRKVVTKDEVTKSNTCVHAWTILKAAEYLTELVKPPVVTFEELKSKGLLNKYIISKANGQPIDEGAEYFVLRLDMKRCHDPEHVKACRRAVLTYATEIRNHLPLLAQELMEKYGPA